MAEGTDWLDFEERLARAILETQKIREESDYAKPMYDAANEAAANEGFDKMAQPIYLLNEYCWNDIQYWAKDLLESKKDEERKSNGKETTRTT